MYNVKKEILSFSLVIISIIVGPWHLALCIFGIFMLFSLLIHMVSTIFYYSNRSVRKRKLNRVKEIFSSINLNKRPPENVDKFNKWLLNEGFKLGVKIDGAFCLYSKTVIISYYPACKAPVIIGNKSGSADGKIYGEDEELRARLLQYFAYITQREKDEFNITGSFTMMQKRTDVIIPQESILSSRVWYIYIRIQGYLFTALLLYQLYDKDIVPGMLSFILFVLYFIYENIYT